MSASAGNGQTRWQALLAAVDGFCAALATTADNELAGLASYSSASTIDEWLTDDHSEVQSTLNNLSPGGWTNIHAGIENGVEIFDDPQARENTNQIMVVMTDGHHNTGPEPILAAEEAADEGIVIFTITFGSGADITRMQAVAAETGGNHYHAPTAAELQEVFQQVVTDSTNLVFANRNGGEMRARMANRRRWRRQRGAATVEFAITLPVVFLMFFSALEFGRMQTIRHTVQNAAYEGARTGVIPGVSDQQIRASTAAVLDAIQTRNSDIDITQGTETVSVTVRAPFRDQSWFAPIYFRNMDLVSTVTLTKDKM